ncbi:hypothetical protein WJX72_000126 [[Myrmecia] bisecta]|uniref:Uncharacterized protein n=1 Tax=[Myrmecia] bisecta TaxID=41462 RepID=A0AAW1QNR4_9CHLO
MREPPTAKSELCSLQVVPKVAEVMSSAFICILFHLNKASQQQLLEAYHKAESKEIAFGSGKLHEALTALKGRLTLKGVDFFPRKSIS